MYGQNPLQYCKVISLQLIKINEKKIQKMKIMAPGSTTSWQIVGDKMETVTVYIFLGSKTTVGSDCNHKIKRQLALWRKNYDKPR